MFPCVRALGFFFTASKRSAGYETKSSKYARIPHEKWTENVFDSPRCASLRYSQPEEMARSQSAPCRPRRGARNSLKGDVWETGRVF